MPSLVKAALDQFYGHYVEYYKGSRKNQEENVNLFSSPPVFILVCNNTSASKEVYKYIAGYEYLDEVWQYHQKMVEAICNGDFEAGYQALVKHTDLIYQLMASTPSQK